MEYTKSYVGSEASNLSAGKIAELTALEALRGTLSDRLDQLENALDRMARARTRIFGAQPQEVLPPAAPETTPNGMLDGLRRDLMRLERARDIARGLADEFDKLA